MVAGVGDPSRTRTLYAVVALLVVVGLSLIMLAIWLVRSTRADPELLAPLEAMSSRKWRRGDPVWQRRRLDEIRPAGAAPLATAVPPEGEFDFNKVPDQRDLDDLLDRVLAESQGTGHGQAGPHDAPSDSPRLGLPQPDPEVLPPPTRMSMAGGAEPLAIDSESHRPPSSASTQPPVRPDDDTGDHQEPEIADVVDVGDELPAPRPEVMIVPDVDDDDSGV